MFWAERETRRREERSWRPGHQQKMFFFCSFFPVQGAPFFRLPGHKPPSGQVLSTTHSTPHPFTLDSVSALHCLTPLNECIRAIALDFSCYATGHSAPGFSPMDVYSQSILSCPHRVGFILEVSGSFGGDPEYIQTRQGSIRNSFLQISMLLSSHAQEPHP